ncbi:MAG: hypothetical protein ACP5OA_06785 [Candidatus Woesearchaeota archaeon]
MALELVRMATEGTKDSGINIWEKHGILLLDKTGFSYGLREVGT